MRNLVTRLLIAVFLLQALVVPIPARAATAPPVTEIASLPAEIELSVTKASNGAGEFWFSLAEEIAGDLVVALPTGAPGILDIALLPVANGSEPVQVAQLPLGPVSPGSESRTPLTLSPATYMIRYQLRDKANKPLAAAATFSFSLPGAAAADPDGPITFSELPGVVDSLITIDETEDLRPFTYTGALPAEAMLTLINDANMAAHVEVEVLRADDEFNPGPPLAMFSPVAPGDLATLPVSLAPGNYLAVARPVTADGQPAEGPAFYTLLFDPVPGDDAEDGGEAAPPTGGGGGADLGNDGNTGSVTYTVDKLPGVMTGQTRSQDGWGEVTIDYSGSAQPTLLKATADPTNGASLILYLWRVNFDGPSGDRSGLGQIGPITPGQAGELRIDLAPGRYAIEATTYDASGLWQPAEARFELALEPAPAPAVPAGPLAGEVRALPYSVTDKAADRREVRLTYTGREMVDANLAIAVPADAPSSLWADWLTVTDSEGQAVARIDTRWIDDEIRPGAILRVPVTLGPGSVLAVDLAGSAGGIGDEPGPAPSPAAVPFTLTLSAPADLSEGLEIPVSLLPQEGLNPLRATYRTEVRVQNPADGWFTGALPAAGEGPALRTLRIDRVRPAAEGESQPSREPIHQLTLAAGDDLPPLWLPAGDLLIEIEGLPAEGGDPGLAGLTLEPAESPSLGGEGLLLAAYASWEEQRYTIPGDLARATAAGLAAESGSFKLTQPRPVSMYGEQGRLSITAGEQRWVGLTPPTGADRHTLTITGEGEQLLPYRLRLVRLDGSEAVTLKGRQRVRTDNPTTDVLPLPGGARWVRLTANTTATTTWLYTGSGSFPVHPSTEKSLAAVDLPVKEQIKVETYRAEGDPQLIEWEIILQAITAYPGDTISLGGSLIPSDWVSLDMNLGLSQPREVDLHLEANGTAATLLTGRVTGPNSYSYGYQPLATFGLPGVDDPSTTVNERVADVKIPIQTEQIQLEMALRGDLPEALRYRMVLSLPPVVGLVVDQVENTGQEAAPAELPLESAQYQSIRLVARGELDGRAINPEWSVIENGGEARITPFGELVGLAPGAVQVKATYKQGDESLTATRDIIITEPLGPRVTLWATPPWNEEGTWSLMGQATAFGDGVGIRTLQWKLDDGAWKPLPAGVRVDGLSTATVSISHDDLLALIGPLDEGSHTLTLRATDSNGITSSAEAEGAMAPIIIDQTPPEITAISPDGGPLASADGLAVSISLVVVDKAGDGPGAGPGVVEVAYRHVETEEWVPAGQAWAFGENAGEFQFFWQVTGLEGDYELSFTAADQRGNKAEPVHATYTLAGAPDTEPPGIWWLNAGGARLSPARLPLMDAETMELGFSVHDNANLDAVWVEARRLTSDPNDDEAIFTEWAAAGSALQRTDAAQRQNWEGEVTLDLSGQPDGFYQVRLVVRDAAGQEARQSEENGRLLLIHRVVTRPAPPAAPQGEALPADQEGGLPPRVTLTWEGPETSPLGYNIYRLDGGEWTLVGQSVEPSYTDANLPAGAASVQYRVTSLNDGGNESDPLDFPPVPLSEDQEPPIVEAFMVQGKGHEPRQMVVVTDGASLIYRASDESALGQALLTVYGPSGEPLNLPRDLGGQQVVNDGFYLETKDWEDGEYTADLVVSDAAGNPTETHTVNFLVDHTPPQPAVEPRAEASDGKNRVIVAWDASPSDRADSPDDDVAGYIIHRLLGAGSTNLGQVEAAGAGYLDEQVTAGLTYRYRIVAVDWAGNLSDPVVTNEVKVGKDETPPVARAEGPIRAQLKEQPDGSFAVTITLDGSRSSDNVGVVRYTWDPRDGSQARDASETQGILSHTYTQPGPQTEKREYTATLTVEDEAGLTATATTTVTILPADAPLVVLKVVDATTGLGIPGVEVIGDGGRWRYPTDPTGLIELTGEPEEMLQLMFFKQAYLGSETAIKLPKSGKATYTWPMDPGELVVGTVEVERLTLEEIEDLGIDINPSDDPDNPNPNRNLFKFKLEVKIPRKGGDPKDAGGVGLIADASGKIHSGGGGGGSGLSVATFPTDGEGPPGVMILHVENPLTWVKEFFKVDVVILNPSSFSFTLSQGKLSIAHGEGLTRVEVKDPSIEVDERVDVPDLVGGEQHTTSWVLRGDKAGDWKVGATYQGKLQPVGKDLSYNFEAKEPVRVYGEKAIKLDVEVLERQGGKAIIKAIVTNQAPIPVYGLEMRLIEEEFLAKEEEPIRKLETLEPKGEKGDRWETLWTIDVGDGELPPLEDLFTFEDPGEIDPDPSWVHFAMGRVLTNDGERVTPVAGAVVSVDNRNVAVTDASGKFVAPVPSGGFQILRIRHPKHAGEWNTTVEIEPSQDGEKEYAWVNSDYKQDGESIGYLITGTTIKAFNEALHKMRDEEKYDQAAVQAVFDWAKEIIDQGTKNVNGRPIDQIGEHDEEALRRMEEVARFMTVNDREVDKAVDAAVSSILDGSLGMVEATVELVNVLDLLARTGKRFPVLKSRVEWLEQVGLPHLEKLKAQLESAAGQQIVSGMQEMIPLLEEQAGPEAAQRVKATLDRALAAIKNPEAGAKQAANEGANYLAEALKEPLTEAITTAYYSAVSKDLVRALERAKARDWREMTFAAAGDQIGDLYKISAEINRRMTQEEQELIWLKDFLLASLEESAELAGEINEGLSGDPAAGEAAFQKIKEKPIKSLKDMKRAIRLVDFSVKPEDAVGFILDQVETWISKSANFTKLAVVGPEQVENGIQTLWLVFSPGGLAHLDREAARYAFVSVRERPQVRAARRLMTPHPNELVRTLNMIAYWLQHPDAVREAALQMSRYSPADLYVVDSQGRAVGVDPVTGQEVNEVEGAYFSGKESHPQSLILPDAAGPYTIQLVGTGEGLVTLDITRYDPAGQSQTLLFVDPITLGARLTYTAATPAGEQESALDLSREGKPVARLALPDSVGAVGESIEMPISLADGSNVASMSLTIPYDPKLIQIDGITDGSFTAAIESEDEGSLKLRLTRSDAAAGLAETAATLSVTLLAEGQAVLDLLGGESTLADAAGEPVAHARAGATLVSGDGTVTLRGRISEPTGEGVEGATVHILPAGGEGPVATATTDEHGLYVITGLAPGEYQIRAEGGSLIEPIATTIQVDSTPDQVLPDLAGLASIDLLELPAPGDAAPAMDFNGDGLVDIGDYVMLVRHFGPAVEGEPYDLDGDGEVGEADLLQLIESVQNNP